MGAGTGIRRRALALAAITTMATAGTAALASAGEPAAPLDRELDGSVRIDVDGDDRDETLTTREVGDAGWRVVLRERCDRGRVRRDLTGTFNAPGPRYALRDLDGRASNGRELWAWGTSGASGREQTARIVRARAGRDDCAKLRTLFRHPSSATRSDVPEGFSRAGASVALDDVVEDRRGVEVIVTEGFVDGDDAFCCPSLIRNSVFGYSARQRRYVLLVREDG